MKPLGAFAEWAEFVLDGDYSPIPIRAGTKRPLFDKWDRLRSTALTPAEIAEMCRKFPDLGLGVAGGFGGLVPVDLDSDDHKITNAVCSALPEILVAKRGRRGFTAFYYDAYGCVKAEKFRTPRRGGGFDMLVEILTTGQSVIPPTLHPDLGEPYRWVTERTLLNERCHELPLITAAHVEALRKAMEPWLAQPRLCQTRAVQPAHKVTNSQMAAYARTTLENAVKDLAALPCGRNWALYGEAAKIGKFIHHGILSRGEVENALMEAMHLNGYTAAKHGGAKQALATLRSGIEKAKGDPLPNLNHRKGRAA